jgi:hypothetical protein
LIRECADDNRADLGGESPVEERLSTVSDGEVVEVTDAVSLTELTEVVVSLLGVAAGVKLILVGRGAGGGGCGGCLASILGSLSFNERGFYLGTGEVGGLAVSLFRMRR